MDGSRPLRVIQTIGDGELGGGTTHVLQLLRGLDRTRWDPVLVCDPRGPLSDLARETGTRVVSVAFRGSRWSPRRARTLRDIVRSESPAVVHAHGSRAAFAAAQALGPASPVPLVYSEHGLATLVERSRPLQWLAARAESRTLRRASRVLVLSEHSRGEVERLVPDALPRVRVSSNAVDPTPSARSRSDARRELRVPESHLLVMSVARLVPQKAPLELIEAAVRVARIRPDVSFVVVGDGPLRRDAERVARRRGAPVRFAGARLDTRDLLPGGDVFCLSSHWEGVPISILEAMAAGLPVVATAVGGVPSIVTDGETGLLVPPGNPPELARAIETLAGEPTTRATLGEAGRQRVLREHTVDHLVARVEAVYAELLDERAAPTPARPRERGPGPCSPDDRSRE